jgi:hypothetical protein
MIYFYKIETIRPPPLLSLPEHVESIEDTPAVAGPGRLGGGIISRDFLPPPNYQRAYRAYF